MKEGFLKSFDDSEIYYYLWDDVEKPKGVVQIFHGMAEHAKRYEDFAKFLNENGYIVFADDHRAHGKTVKSEKELGKYKGTDVYWDTVLDEVFFSKKLVEEYKLPLYVFGHSYGSFLCQGYIEKTAIYEKAILCGSACYKGDFAIKFAKIISKITARHKGPDAPAKMIAKLSFGSYDKKLNGGSWLNTDEAEVKKYYLDKYCGYTLSARFYSDFFSAFNLIYKPYFLKKIKKSKPILLISGKDDMVGNRGKSVQKLFKMYMNLDIKDVEIKLYQNARHEILNEPIKKQVYNDVLNFIEK